MLCYFIAGACRPFLPPENGYYVNEIQRIYFAANTSDNIQVACKDGYVLVSDPPLESNGTAFCQSNGSWSQEFYCLGKYIDTV